MSGRLLRCALMLTFATGALANQQNIAKGFAVDKAYEMNDLDAINTFNGNLTVTIPIGMRYSAGGGLSYQFVLSYGGNSWAMTADEWVKVGTEEAPQTVNYAYVSPDKATNAGFGWHLSLGYIDLGDTGRPYVSSDGARHYFYDHLHSTNETVTPGVAYTRDGSYLRRRSSGVNTIVEFPDGTLHTFDSAGRITTMEDRFGNTVGIRYVPGTDGAADWIVEERPPGGGTPFRTHTVDMIRVTRTGEPTDHRSVDLVKTVTLAAAPNVPSNTYTLGYLAADGVGEAYTYAPFSRRQLEQQNCEAAGPVAWTPILRSVVLPDGSKYTIDTDRGDAMGYSEPDPLATARPGPNCTHMVPYLVHHSFSGYLKSITRPTGASIHWTYKPYSFPVQHFHQNCEGLPCDLNLEARNGLGVAKRTEKTRSGTVISVRKYEQLKENGLPGLIEDGTNPATAATKVTTYAANESTVRSSSVHYYTLPASSWHDTTQYGLPFTTKGGLAPPNDTNPRDGRHLSTKFFDENGNLLRYTYVQYEADAPVGLFEDSTNRRVKSERTVNLLASGLSDLITTHDEFDGFGHYRKTTTSTAPGTAPAINRTTWTLYNKPDPQTDPNAFDSGSIPGTFHQIDPSDAWVLNTYSSQVMKQGTAYNKALFLFDRSTGFLQRRRTLQRTTLQETTPEGVVNVSLDEDDLLAVFTHARGNVATEKYYGGDGQAIGTTTLEGTPPTLVSLVPPATPVASLAHAYAFGSLESSHYVPFKFFSKRQTIDPKTGLATESFDSAGVSTSFEYDWAGRMIWSVPIGGAVTEYVYAPPISAPPEITINQRNGGKTGGILNTAVVKFDDFGRVTRETRNMPNGVTSSRQTLYNDRGLVQSISEWGSTGLTTDYTYDALGRVLTVTGPDDSVVSTTYDGTRTTSRTVSVATSEAGQTPVTTTETTDALGRLTNVLSPSGTSTTYDYDVGGRLSKVTMVADGVTQTRTFAYDGRGFLQSEEHPESDSTSYTYDARGHVLTRTDSRPATVTFTYDTAERLTKVAHGSTTLKTFTYDRSAADKSMGKLSSSTRTNPGMPGGEITVTETYRYDNDAAGRLSSKETQIGTGPVFVDSYQYDALGAITAIDYPNCDNCAHPARTVTNTYEQGWLTAVPGYTTSGTNDGITYHRNGLVDEVRHLSVASTSTVEKQSYDITNGMARPSKIEFSGFCNGFDGTPFLSGTTVSANTPANLTISVSGASTYQWYTVSASGVSTPITGQTTNTLTKGFTATTQVWVRVGDGTCTADSNVATVTVNACTAPDATITVTPARVDRDRAGTASVPDGGANAQYQWQLTGGGRITSADNPRAITFEVDCTGAPVSLNVTVTTCQVASGSKSVPIGDATGVTLSFTGSSVIKAGDSTSIEAQLTGTAPWTIKWSDQTQGNSTSSSVVSRTFSPPVTTSYTLMVTDDCGTVTSSPLTVTVLPAPANLVAEAASATVVDLAWSYGGAADSFKVRRTGGGATTTITLAGSARTFSDSNRAANTAYTYEVYAVKTGVNSAFSNTELATTTVFGADIAAGSRVAAADVEMLRTAVNAVRARAGLSTAVLTDPGPLSGTTVKAIHFTELRAALDQARSLLGLSATSSSTPSPATGVSIRAVHMNELRGGVR